jgi:hypothetical protein
MHVRAVAALAVAALVTATGATVAQACGGGDPMNLTVPVTLHSTLRAVYLKSHPALRSEDVVGPLPGRTYYGSYGDFHAVATFQIKGQPAYPATFWRNFGHGWRFSHDTHGGVRIWDISPDLLRLWGFHQWRHSPYYVEPR